MLKSFVENKHVIFCDSFDDWRDAIRAAAQPMIADGTIDDEYIVKLIKNVEEWGPLHPMLQCLIHQLALVASIRQPLVS